MMPSTSSIARVIGGSVALLLGAQALWSAHRAATDRPARTLRAPRSFAHIADRDARAVALFREAGVVILDRRCVNCHPRTDRPNQSEDGHAHQPEVHGGAYGVGLPGLPCAACHQAVNVALTGATLASIPGNPKWALAPRVMAWEGRSLGDICRQIKDPARNGGKSLEQLYDHMAHDILVGWGWAPGPGRRPVAGTQAEFGALIGAWIDSGAACPAA